MIPVIEGDIPITILDDRAHSYDAITRKRIVLCLVVESHRLRTDCTTDNDIGRSSIIIEDDIIARSHITGLSVIQEVLADSLLPDAIITDSVPYNLAGLSHALDNEQQFAVLICQRSLDIIVYALNEQVRHITIDSTNRTKFVSTSFQCACIVKLNHRRLIAWTKLFPDVIRLCFDGQHIGIDLIKLSVAPVNDDARAEAQFQRRGSNRPHIALSARIDGSVIIDLQASHKLSTITDQRGMTVQPHRT